MTQVAKRVLTVIAWALMALGPLYGLWTVLEIVTGAHTVLGPADFVLRQWMTWLMVALGPVAQGAVLLLTMRIYERLVEERA